MAIIKNAEILATYHIVKAKMEMVNNESNNIRNEKSRLDKFVPNDARNLYTRKQSETGKFIDEVRDISFDLAVIALVSKFEKIAFEKYTNTFGSLRAVIHNNAQRPLAYFASKEKFIRDDVDNLGGIIKLIAGHIDNTTFEEFEEIKYYRDYIAHGKRFPKRLWEPKSIDDIAEILDRVISAIEK